MKSVAYHIRDPRNPRPLLYAYKDPKEPHCYWFHGMCFAEFHAAMKLDRTLVLLSDRGDLDIDDDDPLTRFNFVEPADLPCLARQNIYEACGDFIWVDTPSWTSLRYLVPADVAALLYMGHTFKPLGSPFFRTLKNRFAYLSHDDGWVLRLYARHPMDVARLLEAVISQKSRRFHKTRIPTKDLGKKLLQFAKQGLFLDFRGESDGASVRLSLPGPFIDMDALLHAHAASPFAPFAELTRKGWGDVN